MNGPAEIHQAGIVVNPRVDSGYSGRFIAALERFGVEVVGVEEPAGEKRVYSAPDIVFVLGGDGTMLRASKMYPGRVLLGVNFGRLGFMSGMVPEDMETSVEKVLSGRFHVQEYRMLDAWLEGAEEPLRAVNEAALVKKVPHHLTSVDVAVGGEDLASLRCDGFVAATPLGSTAYALSAGGPIVSGDVACYVLVAIAPHSLVARPLVLGGDQVTELRVTELGALLSIDGEEPREILPGGFVRLGLSTEKVRIARTDEWTWWRAVRRTFL